MRAPPLPMSLGQFALLYRFLAISTADDPDAAGSVPISWRCRLPRATKCRTSSLYLEGPRRSKRKGPSIERGGRGFHAAKVVAGRAVGWNRRIVFTVGLGLSAPWQLVGRRLDKEKRPNERHLEVVADRGVLFACPLCKPACTRRTTSSASPGRIGTSSNTTASSSVSLVGTDCAQVWRNSRADVTHSVRTLARSVENRRFLVDKQKTIVAMLLRFR